MHFVIDPKIFEQFPELNLGVIVATTINNEGKGPEILESKEREIREKFDMDKLNEQPKILAWREAYKTFGGKPKKYKCSVENLYKMIIEGIDLRQINKLVDIYNYISLKYMIPVGGDDLEKIENNIMLTYAKGNEPFFQLNGNEVTHPKKGEVIYRDEKDVLCRRWNWRECEKSKMTEQTQHAVLVAEGLPPVTKEEMEEIVEELASLIKEFCGGNIEYKVLNKDKNVLDINY